LVTGGSGQLGSEVARALVARGDTVRCLLRDPARARLLDGVAVERVQGDVTAPETLGAAVSGCDAVLHLAGVVSYSPGSRARQQAVNVGGTRDLLDAAAAAGVGRFVLTSSIAAIGFVEGPGEGDEDAPYNWGPYGLGYMDTKRESEALVLGDRRVEGIAVNPGIVFGARDLHQNGGRMLLQVAAGGPPAVPPGATTCATLGDVGAGHLLALDRGRPGHRYVLGGTTGTFAEIFARVAAVMGRPAPTRVAPRAALVAFGALQELKARFTGGEPPLTRSLARVSCKNRRYRSDRAITELGYAPSPLEEGIRACRDWYRAEGLLDAPASPPD
jgi:dihydroflavonol-4-reductase